MDWGKIGASVGTQLVKTLYKKNDEELHEVKRQRDVYKKEAECLKSHLHDVKRYSHGQSYKPNNHYSHRNFNRGIPPSAKKEATTGSHKQFPEKKSQGNNGNSRGYSHNSNSSNTQQSSSWFFGFLSTSSSNDRQTNSSGSSNFSGSSGRGSNSHFRSRGGYRGNRRGRGSSRQ